MYSGYYSVKYSLIPTKHYFQFGKNFQANKIKFTEVELLYVVF